MLGEEFDETVFEGRVFDGTMFGETQSGKTMLDVKRGSMKYPDQEGSYTDDN